MSIRVDELCRRLANLLRLPTHSGEGVSPVERDMKQLIRNFLKTSDPHDPRRLRSPSLDPNTERQLRELEKFWPSWWSTLNHHRPPPPKPVTKVFFFSEYAKNLGAVITTGPSGKEKEALLTSITNVDSHWIPSIGKVPIKPSQPTQIPIVTPPVLTERPPPPPPPQPWRPPPPPHWLLTPDSLTRKYNLTPRECLAVLSSLADMPTEDLAQLISKELKGAEKRR